MEVISCGIGNKKVVVTPKAYDYCVFKIIDDWDENKYAKNCDIMYYLRNGAGAYVWDCEHWVFLDFSGGNQSNIEQEIDDLKMMIADVNASIDIIIERSNELNEGINTRFERTNEEINELLAISNQHSEKINTILEAMGNIVGP